MSLDWIDGPVAKVPARGKGSDCVLCHGSGKHPDRPGIACPDCHGERTNPDHTSWAAAQRDVEAALSDDYLMPPNERKRP